MLASQSSDSQPREHSRLSPEMCPTWCSCGHIWPLLVAQLLCVGPVSGGEWGTFTLGSLRLFSIYYCCWVFSQATLQTRSGCREAMALGDGEVLRWAPPSWAGQIPVREGFWGAGLCIWEVPTPLLLPTYPQPHLLLLAPIAKPPALPEQGFGCLVVQAGGQGVLAEQLCLPSHRPPRSSGGDS